MRLTDVYAPACCSCGQGRLTWRELANLVRGLSPQSATRTALNDGTPEPSPEVMLLADLFDMTQAVDWHVQAANAQKKSDLPKPPKPYPRWWDTKTSKRRDSPERVAKLDAARQRKRDREQAIAEGRIA